MLSSLLIQPSFLDARFRPGKPCGRDARASLPGLAYSLSGSQGDLCSLHTLWTARHCDLNSGTFVQTPIALRLNRGEVYEYVFSVLPLNEAIPFGCVEPLHCTFFFHLCFLCAVMRTPLHTIL